MKWRKGMKVECIKECYPFEKGDIVTLTERYRGKGWEIKEFNIVYINDKYKKYWKVLEENMKDKLVVGQSVVELRNGDVMFLVMSKNDKKVFVSGAGTWSPISNYDDNLKNKFKKRWDIVKIGKFDYVFKLFYKPLKDNVIWLEEINQENIPEKTIKELQEELGYEFKIVKEVE